MSYYKIPITTAPNATYTFRVALKGDTINKDIRIFLRYLDLYDLWMMDVYDDGQNKLLVAGIPLVPGVNMLGQHEYSDVGEAYIINAKNSDKMQPDNIGLGADYILVWGDAS